jgi:hypothetical protein
VTTPFCVTAMPAAVLPRKAASASVPPAAMREDHGGGDGVARAGDVDRLDRRAGHVLHRAVFREDT